MKRTKHIPIALVGILATLLLAMHITYGQSRPRRVTKPAQPNIVISETRPRRVLPQKPQKQVQIPTSEQFVDRLHRWIDEYFRPVNR